MNKNTKWSLNIQMKYSEVVLDTSGIWNINVQDSIYREMQDEWNSLVTQARLLGLEIEFNDNYMSDDLTATQVWFKKNDERSALVVVFISGKENKLEEILMRIITENTFEEESNNYIEIIKRAGEYIRA